MKGGRKDSKGKTDKERAFSSALSIILILLNLVVIYELYYASYLGLAAQAGWAIVSLLVSGLVIKRLKWFPGGYGFYLLGTKRGLGLIDRTSKSHRGFWNAMPMWGMVLGFGLLSRLMVRKGISNRMYAFGIITMLLLTYVATFYTIGFLQFLTLPHFQLGITPQSAVQYANPLLYNLTPIAAIFIVTLVFGFSGYLLSLLLLNTGTILFKTLLYANTAISGNPQTTLLTSQIPGVAPVLPGLTLPLIAGLCSFVIIITIHEFSHGVLARIAKVKLKTIGMIMVGAIPFGAFVEPDERAVARLDADKQTRILAAGVASNFIAMSVFFVLMMLVAILFVPGIYSVIITATIPNTPAYGVLQPGMQILSWNGYTIRNYTDIATASKDDKPNSTVTVVTNTGTYSFKAVASADNVSRGIIGINAGDEVGSTLYDRVVYFFYSLFVITFALNFFIGIVNLLPIPGFDGWRIYKVNIKSNRAVKAITAIVVIALLINFVPWLWLL